MLFIHTFMFRAFLYLWNLFVKKNKIYDLTCITTDKIVIGCDPLTLSRPCLLFLMVLVHTFKRARNHKLIIIGFWLWYVDKLKRILIWHTVFLSSKFFLNFLPMTISTNRSSFMKKIMIQKIHSTSWCNNFWSWWDSLQYKNSIISQERNMTCSLN